MFSKQLSKKAMLEPNERVTSNATKLQPTRMHIHIRTNLCRSAGKVKNRDIILQQEHKIEDIIQSIIN